MREIRTPGSVRGRSGNGPVYSTRFDLDRSRPSVGGGKGFIDVERIRSIDFLPTPIKLKKPFA